MSSRFPSGADQDVVEGLGGGLQAVLHLRVGGVGRRLPGREQGPLVDRQRNALVGGVHDHGRAHAARTGLVGARAVADRRLARVRPVEPGPSRRVVSDVGGERLDHVRALRQGGELGRREGADADFGDPGVQRLELGVVGDVERVAGQPGIALVLLNTGYEFGQQLRQEQGRQFQSGDGVAIGPVDGERDGEPGDRDRRIHHRLSITQWLGLAGEGRRGRARRHLVAGLRLALAHVVEGERVLVLTQAEVRLPLVTSPAAGSRSRRRQPCCWSSQWDTSSASGRS